MKERRTSKGGDEGQGTHLGTACAYFQPAVSKVQCKGKARIIVKVLERKQAPAGFWLCVGMIVASAGCEGTTSTSGDPPVSQVRVTISPTSATVQTEASQQFAATVTGTSITSVEWSVNGITGGNSTVGTISIGPVESGLYSAPAVVPTPNTVTVKATSRDDYSASASAPVTVAPSVLAGIQQVGTLAVTGSPAGVLVDVARNKVYVSDAAGGTIQVFDGGTHQLLKTITGCAGVLASWVIDQEYGKIYAGCGWWSSTGVRDGDRKIRVIDTRTDAIAGVIDLGTTGLSYFVLAIDQTRHRVWISHQRAPGAQIAVIDVPTDAVTFVDTYGAMAYGSLSVNETTNKIYVVRTQFRDVLEIDGNTLAITRSLSPPYAQPVQSGINRRENKLYVKTIGGPGGRPAVCAYAMSQASPACVPIAGNDWGGIVTNETTNVAYLGVEVGDRIGVVDGASDLLVAEIPMHQATGIGGSTNQSHMVVVNEGTNHAFFVNRNFLLALDGPTRLFRRITYADPTVTPGSGSLSQSIAINRSRNRIYVVYDGTRVSKVAVIQDR